MKRIATRLYFVWILTWLFVAFLPTLAAGQSLGISGNRFTVDGTPRFLVFVSYFDAMDVPDANAIADFDQLRAWGVDGIRIFPNWWTWQPFTFAGDTIIAPDGSIRETPFLNMVWYLDRARERGLLVDLSFTGETVSSCTDCAVDFSLNDLTFSAYLNGIQTVASRLSGYRNILFDIQNESNINGPDHRTPLSESQISQIVQAVHSPGVDPSRIVTASVDQNFSTTGVGIRANNSGQDAATWHEPRIQNWWLNTVMWLNQIRSATGKPIYLQEPERLRPPDGDNSSWFTSTGLKRAVKEAKNGCAAAWTFHTSAAFQMNGSSLLNQLQPMERDFLSTFKAATDLETWCQ
jgi:hypothetical protein